MFISPKNKNGRVRYFTTIFFLNMVTSVKKAGKRKLEFGKSPYRYWGRGEEMGRNELAFSPS